MDWEVAPPAPGDGIEDVQGRADERRVAIDAVGVRGVRHPLIFEDDGTVQHTVAVVRLAVELPPERRGTHMSRLVSLLTVQRKPLSAATLPRLLADVAARLDAHAAEVEFRFPYFLEKQAPASGLRSLMDYEVILTGRLAGGKTRVTTEVSVPVTSLCPCSKEISQYGAHNQRSHLSLAVEAVPTPAVSELIAIAEEEASAPVYGVVKRADEKALTERAYENPKFVEDMVRDVALRLRSDPRIRQYRVEAENLESIHNHSAYAVIDSTEV